MPTEKALDLLAIFHRILGFFVGLIACLPLIHVTVGILLILGLIGPPQAAGAQTVFGIVFVLIGASFVAGGWTLAVALTRASKNLRARRHHQYCLVVAAVTCILFPVGTVLGIFTILTLIRDDAKPLFAAEPPAAAS